jgi:hypothetical protein
VVEGLLPDPLHLPAYRKGHTYSTHPVVSALFVTKYCRERKINDVKKYKKSSKRQDKREYQKKRSKTLISVNKVKYNLQLGLSTRFDAFRYNRQRFRGIAPHCF